MPLQVELVSPERIAYSGEATMVVARSLSGDIAFLPGHVPYLGVLAVHPVKLLLEGGGEQLIAVHSGFVEVTAEKVSILSDTCELPEQIDVERARAALERAEEALRADPADEEARAAKARAEVRLQVAGAA